MEDLIRVKEEIYNMSFKVRMIGNEEVRTSERGWSGCDERISKKPSEKMSF